jgi:hypothetical protein
VPLHTLVRPMPLTSQTTPGRSLVSSAFRRFRTILRSCVLTRKASTDLFPLPHIDQVVDSTAGSVLLCFLDCYSGYHQIALHPDDEAQKAFESLKESLMTPPVMTPPIPKETLLLYISATTNVVSTVLVAK